MPRRLRLALTLAVLGGICAALVAVRGARGWRIAPGETGAWHCKQGYAASCLWAAREYIVTDELEPALAAADRGCLLGSAESCRVQGAILCRPGALSSPPKAADAYLRGCQQGDRTSCHELSVFVLRPDLRDAIPRTGVTRPAWVAAAVDAAAQGAPDTARQLLAQVEPGPYQIAFLEAAIAIDQQDYERAGEHLERLEDRYQDSVEVKILRRLLEADRKREHLVVAGLEEWAAHGAPDLRESPWLGQHRIVSIDSCYLGADTTEQAIELAVMSSASPRQGEVTPAELRQAALSVAPGASMAARLLALAQLDRPEQSPEAADARQQRARLVQSFSSGAKDNLFFALWRVVATGSKDAPLTRAQLEALEAVAKSSWRPPRREVAEELRKWEPKGAPADTFVPLMVDILWSERFGSVADRTVKALEQASPSERQRFGAALTQLGNGVSRGGWLLELMVGSRMITQGASLTGSQANLERAKAVRAHGRTLFGESSFEAGFSVWPLRRLGDDEEAALIDDEVAYKESIARLGQR